jgi:Sulfatase-modifying factor enzyme 1
MPAFTPRVVGGIVLVALVCAATPGVLTADAPEPVVEPVRADGVITGEDDAGLVDGGSYADGASPYGAYNMAGNAWEWVADWYDDAYYRWSVDRDPPGPTSGRYRVLRGGSWDNAPGHLRTTERNYDRPDIRNGNFGFRGAKGRS